MAGTRIRNMYAAVAAAALLVMAPADRPAHAQAVDSLPMWQVSDGTRSLYLLGSIHLLRPSVYPLSPAIYRAFDSADVVAFEMDFDEMMKAAPSMVQRGMLPEGRTLRDELPDDLADDLERRLGAMGLPAAAVQRMKPWFAALTMSTAVLQQAGFDAGSGIDMHFHGRAGEANKRIVGLETMEEQLDVFDELDREAQVAFMRQTLRDLDNSADQLDEATTMWQRGDAAGLAAMFTESMREQPVLTERILYARNRNWIPQIESLLRSDEPAIVIVGMGHLIGEQSVVDLLRRQGYTVRRITCPADELLCAA